MYRKKQPKKPLFAEVKLTDEELRQQVANQVSNQEDRKGRSQRIPYIKLTYPNGVTLNLPTTLDVKVIEQYIHINV